MAYDAKQIANWFITHAASKNRTVSITQLLKLVYISHGWYLAIYSAPLIKNQVQAWQYGPVIPVIYVAFRRQGIDSMKVVPIVAKLLMTKDETLLKQIYEIYGEMPSYQLADLIKKHGSPWDLTIRIAGNYSIILDDIIKDYYKEKHK